MTKRRRRGPGERAGLERGSVLLAARAVAERDGISQMSMRRLADEVGVAPNAIYSHFADKQSLLDALADDLIADVAMPDTARGDWRDRMCELMDASRTLLLAHPALIPLLTSRPGRGPNAIRLGEVMLALLERGGIGGQAAVDAMRILIIYVFGFAAHEAPRRADPEPTGRIARNEEAFRSAALPHVRANASAMAQHPGHDAFIKGLRWLLDGIASSGGR
jgi:TetR/AcrR family tetracycline transcriptional repressor